MSSFLAQIIELVRQGNVRISDHGYDELAEDGIYARDLVNTISDAIMIEDYPEYPKGPCVLVLHTDRNGKPVHAVWGIPKGEVSPVVLVTAYRPDPDRWSKDFTRRK